MSNIICFPSPTPSRWRENAEARLANQDTRRKARKMAMCILNAMENKGISETDLSVILRISSAELLEILKGHQLPSESVRQLIEKELGVTL